MIKKTTINQRGFTFIELVITIAIAGILLAVAIPNYADFTRRQAIKASAQTLVKAFAAARVEAVTSSQGAATVCWNFGLAVIPLPGATGGETIGATEIVVYRNTLANVTEIISATQLLVGQQSLRITNVANDADNCVGFNGQGRLTGNAGVNPVAFLLCRQLGGNDNTNSLRVEINTSGRAVSKRNEADGTGDTTGVGIQACI